MMLQPKRISFLLENRKITKKEIANRLVRSASSLSHILKGERSIEDEEVESLANTLRVSKEYLLRDISALRDIDDWQLELIIENYRQCSPAYRKFMLESTNQIVELAHETPSEKGADEL